MSLNIFFLSINYYNLKDKIKLKVNFSKKERNQLLKANNGC